MSSYAGVYEFRYVDDSTGPVSRYEVIQRGTSLWVRGIAEGKEQAPMVAEPGSQVDGAVGAVRKREVLVRSGFSARVF